LVDAYSYACQLWHSLWEVLEQVFEGAKEIT